MYRIDRTTNRIEPLSMKTFTELGFKERDHLQEWLAHTPQALGEDLLIIQKEFDGFDETRERPDLLALDKDGRIVVIENKLDDSGRDVVWQALKYASYCSSLKKDQIVDIFQRYLLRHGSGDARQRLSEFFDGQEVEELKLNPGNEQRVILVAANFRKEVTSTVLWLLGHNVRLQCFKVTPFERGSDLYLNVDQIIPTPEAASYMIGLAEKDASMQSDEVAVKQRDRLRLAFWTQALAAVRASPCGLFANVTPSERAKASAGAGIGSVWYEMVFLDNQARVQMYFERREAEENKAMFDRLESRRKQIEEEFGDALVWNRMDGLIGAQVQYAKEFNGRDEDQWPAMIAWLVKYVGKLEAALRGPLLEIEH